MVADYEDIRRKTQTLRGSELGRFLYRRARELLEQGAPRESLINVYRQLYVLLGERGREEDQDAVADVLDSLEGYSSPTARL
jgi:hypothetical protein